jgi:hypothetical protein
MRLLFIIGSLWLCPLFIIGSFAGDSPNPQITPGMVNPALTKEVLCAKGFSTSKVRNVADEKELKISVYAHYGMLDHKDTCALVAKGCEVDHLIPLEIGGLTDIDNLWPQPYGTKPWNANVKDRLENRLHRLVCSDVLTLGEAQHVIATDWIAAYKRYCVLPEDCPIYKK